MCETCMKLFYCEIHDMHDIFMFMTYMNYLEIHDSMHYIFYI